jgi:hypothetical protein
MERLYIYKTTKCKEILNEQHVGESSVLFDLALKYKTDEGNYVGYPETAVPHHLHGSVLTTTSPRHYNTIVIVERGAPQV